jgi:hypothetical protein
MNAQAGFPSISGTTPWDPSAASVFLQAAAQRFARIVLMMQMNLDLAEPHSHHLRERLDQGRVVLRAREEE